MEVITKEEVLKSAEIKDLIEFLAHNNRIEFNLLKAVEEASEFIEASTKLQTKSKKNPKRPTHEDVLGEYADVMLRGRIYVQSVFSDMTYDEVDNMIIDHVEKKYKSLIGCLKDDKYTTGL